MTSACAIVGAVRKHWGCAWRRGDAGRSRGDIVPLRGTMHIFWRISPDSVLRHWAPILGSMPQYQAMARLQHWHQAGSWSRAKTAACVRMAALGTWCGKGSYGVRPMTFPRCPDTDDRGCYQTCAHASQSVAPVTG